MKNLTVIALFVILLLLGTVVVANTAFTEAVATAWLAVISTLAGVLLTYLFSVLHEQRKQHLRQGALRHAISDELRSNISMFETKRGLARDYEQSVRQNSTFGAYFTPFMHMIYNANAVELYSFLTLEERNALHIIYARLSELDRLLAAFASGEARHSDPATFIARIFAPLQSFESLCASTEELIRLYIDGSLVESIRAKMTAAASAPSAGVPATGAASVSP